MSIHACILFDQQAKQGPMNQKMNKKALEELNNLHYYIIVQAVALREVTSFVGVSSVVFRHTYTDTKFFIG